MSAYEENSLCRVPMIDSRIRHLTSLGRKGRLHCSSLEQRLQGDRLVVQDSSTFRVAIYLAREISSQADKAFADAGRCQREELFKLQPFKVPKGRLLHKL